jgi:hypothetical protein
MDITAISIRVHSFLQINLTMGKTTALSNDNTCSRADTVTLSTHPTGTANCLYVSSISFLYPYFDAYYLIYVLLVARTNRAPAKSGLIVKQEPAKGCKPSTQSK